VVVEILESLPLHFWGAFEQLHIGCSFWLLLLFAFKLLRFLSLVEAALIGAVFLSVGIEGVGTDGIRLVVSGGGSPLQAELSAELHLILRGLLLAHLL
jgi:hypothetical protein